MSIKYKNGDIQRIFDTEKFLKREYEFVRKEMIKFRKDKKFSVREMGDYLGCSGMNISLVERGKARPNENILNAFIHLRLKKHGTNN